MSGDFTVINDRLVEDLRERDRWDDEMVDRIKFHDARFRRSTPSQMMFRNCTALRSRSTRVTSCT